MRYFLDTEFIEDGKTIDLISIGIVTEDGREYYRQNAECRFGRANEWVKENVLPHLLDFNLDMLVPTYIGRHAWSTREQIAETIKRFVASDPAIEFWTYYGAYDWVALCQLYGKMIDLPQGRLTCPQGHRVSPLRLNGHEMPLSKGVDATCLECGIVKVESRGKFPMYSMDIKQLCVMMGNPELPKQESTEHHALADAKWNKQAYDFLMEEAERAGFWHDPYVIRRR